MLKNVGRHLWTFSKEVCVRAVGAEGIGVAGVGMASLYFGRSVHPISTRAAEYAPPPIFSDLPTVLYAVSPSPLIDLGDSSSSKPAAGNSNYSRRRV